MSTDWNDIVRRHGPMVFGTAWRILGHAADAEDVVQQVFLEVFHLQKRQAVRHWGVLLRQIATRRSLDELRRRRAVTTGGESHLVELATGEKTPGPDAVAIGRELKQRLRDAISRLPEREAAVFCLRYFEDLSNTQIAQTLDVTPGAVATALHKARAKLETQLTEGTD